MITISFAAETETCYVNCTPTSLDGDVRPAEVTTTTVAESQPPSGGLPFTGGDVLGLTSIGLALTVIGAAFVRRARHARHAAA